MRLKKSSSMTGVPLRVALVRQGVGHRICFLSTQERENYAVKKGLLWQQRDKLFSRWKERYFILTKDYLACFKKSSKIANSDMGGFIFKLSLADVDGLEWIEKKDGGVIAMYCPPEGRFFLKAKSELEEWLQVLRESISLSKGRREALRSSINTDAITQSQIYENAYYSNRKVPLHQTYSDCGPELYRLGRNCSYDFVRGSTGLLRISEDRSSISSSAADSSRFSFDDTPTPSPSSSSCSTASRSCAAPPHFPFPSGVPMGHRRSQSHGRPVPRLPEPIIIYTNPRISPRVDRSRSDACQLEAEARRRIQSERDLTNTAPSLRQEQGKQLNRRQSAKQSSDSARPS